MIDLRSDTVTKPTPAMRRAMADAEVGDDVYGEDPTVNRLQERAAELLGKEAALYVPSGTMANQLALRVLARPGTEVLCAARAHVFRYEAAAAAWNSAVQLHPFPDDDGLLDTGALDETARDAGHHSPDVSLIAIENTHMPTCGRPWHTEEVAAAGLVALDSMIDRLADDHRRARRVAEAVADRWPGAVVPDAVDTNMVCVIAERLPSNLLDRLDAEGIRAGTIDTRTVRFATHKDVDDADIERVLKTFERITRD